MRRIANNLEPEERFWLPMGIDKKLARWDEIRDASKRIAGGRSSQAEAQRIADHNPPTAFINHDIHSTEIGSSQTSVDLVYRLATGAGSTH